MTTPWPIILPGRIVGGKIQTNAKRLAAELKNRRDCEIEIVIERKHATRSVQANRYYWGVVLKLIAEHTGHTADELHEYFKLRFNAKPLVICNEHGEIVSEERIGQTTTKLNKITFGEFIESIRAWAGNELQIEIPPADPNWSQRDEELVG